MKKILVIGSGGAGKSTFAVRLGKALDLDVIHLDRLYWKPNWIETPKDEWKETVDEVLKRDSWIMDGNYSGTRETRIRSCDTVILLDIPRSVCLYRILKRVMLYRNKTRPDMAEGCRERFDWDFIKWVWNYPNGTLVRVLDELDSHSDKKVVILRSTRQIDGFFQTIRSISAPMDTDKE